MSRDMMAAFELYQPDTVEGAVDLLERFGEDGWAMAGGNDSLDWFKDRVKRPKYVVDLTGVTALKGIRETADGGVEIGALTTLTEIERSELVHRHMIEEVPARFVERIDEQIAGSGGCRNRQERLGPRRLGQPPIGIGHGDGLNAGGQKLHGSRPARSPIAHRRTARQSHLGETQSFQMLRGRRVEIALQLAQRRTDWDAASDRNQNVPPNQRMRGPRIHVEQSEGGVLVAGAVGAVREEAAVVRRRNPGDRRQPGGIECRRIDQDTVGAVVTDAPVDHGLVLTALPARVEVAIRPHDRRRDHADFHQRPQAVFELPAAARRS